MNKTWEITEILLTKVLLCDIMLLWDIALR